MRLASDIGGTFTDLVYLDERSGRLGSTEADTFDTPCLPRYNERRAMTERE